MAIQYEAVRASETKVYVKVICPSFVSSEFFLVNFQIFLAVNKFLKALSCSETNPT